MSNIRKKRKKIDIWQVDLVVKSMIFTIKNASRGHIWVSHIRRLIETCFGGTEIEIPFKMLLCGTKKKINFKVLYFLLIKKISSVGR